MSIYDHIESMDSLRCPLCLSIQQLKVYFKKISGETYHHCSQCDLIFLDPQYYLSAEEERKRYLTHENDVHDSGYQNYLRPVVEAVLQRQSAQQKGLDYGCGPGSVVCFLLQQQKYHIQGYDPYFQPRSEILKQLFDYIVCTEVAEHFYKPHEEFERLNLLLKPQGSLYIRTALTDFVQDFERWHYHRDPTHVVFYSKKSLKWMAQNWGWVQVELEKDKIVFKRS